MLSKSKLDDNLAISNRKCDQSLIKHNYKSDELPQGSSGKLSPPYLIGEPNAERPAAALTRMAVAAKNTSGTGGLALWACVIESLQEAVLNQHADALAVRTGFLFESFADRIPLPVALVEPLRAGHRSDHSSENLDCSGARGRRGMRNFSEAG